MRLCPPIAVRTPPVHDFLPERDGWGSASALRSHTGGVDKSVVGDVNHILFVQKLLVDGFAAHFRTMEATEVADEIALLWPWRTYYGSMIPRDFLATVRQHQGIGWRPANRHDIRVRKDPFPVQLAASGDHELWHFLCLLLPLSMSAHSW
jgi:hypothetical protein